MTWWHKEPRHQQPCIDPVPQYHSSFSTTSVNHISRLFLGDWESDPVTMVKASIGIPCLDFPAIWRYYKTDSACLWMFGHDQWNNKRTWNTDPWPISILINGFMEDCSASIPKPLEMLQSCTKPSIQCGPVVTQPVFSKMFIIDTPEW